MEQDYTFSGFFKISEEDNGIVITTLAERTDYKTLKSYGVWYWGFLLISANGNYVEADVANAYEVQYSWAGMDEERVLRITNLVYIDLPVTEKTWFGLSSETRYLPNSRYIVDRTKTQHGMKRYFNHTVTLISK